MPLTRENQTWNREPARYTKYSGTSYQPRSPRKEICIPLPTPREQSHLSSSPPYIQLFSVSLLSFSKISILQHGNTKLPPLPPPPRRTPPPNLLPRPKPSLSPSSLLQTRLRMSLYNPLSPLRMSFAARRSEFRSRTRRSINVARSHDRSDIRERGREGEKKRESV